jgi:hypothetical protein
VALCRIALQNKGLLTESLKEKAMNTCLIVIDDQESFRHRTDWNEALAAAS